jgi:hypothetical protein
MFEILGIYEVLDDKAFQCTTPVNILSFITFIIELQNMCNNTYLLYLLFYTLNICIFMKKSF